MSLGVHGVRGVSAIGVPTTARTRWNLGVPQLYEAALARGEAVLAAEGPLVARTGSHAGRAPNDKFIVDEPSTHDVFNPDMPVSCPGVPDDVLDPRMTWHDKAQYDRQAVTLAQMFVANFGKFDNDGTADVKAAGPVA